MGHAFDGVGFAIVEVDGGGDEGDHDHHGLHWCHRHDEGLASIERDCLHDRHGEDDGRERGAHGDVDRRLHAIAQCRA